MTTQLITLKQKPIIEFSGMVARGLEVKQQIAEMNIDTIKPTDANRSMMKKMRAGLNKELKVFEDQRKMIFGAITTPYNEFNDSYESNIKIQFSEAEKALKEKISEVETRMLENKKKEMQAHFDSVASDFASFLSLDNVGLNIILSASDAKLKKQIDSFVSDIEADVVAIGKMENSTRVMSLYETTLDLPGSIARIKDDIEREERLEKVRIEKARIAEENRIKREKEEKERKEREALERAERKEREAIQAEERRIQAEKNAKANKTREAENEVKRLKKIEEQARIDKENAETEQKRLIAEREAVEKRKAEESKIYTMSFKVRGTISQLKEIKQFMDNLGVNYE